MKGVGGELDPGELLISDDNAHGILAAIELGPHPESFVAPIRLTMATKFTSGFPRQFIAMCENRRCSILFHLLVPGGK